jgi:hypothetical protein
MCHNITLHIVLFPLQKGPKVLAGSHAPGPTLAGFFVIIFQSLPDTWHKRVDILCHIITKITFDFSLHDACRHQPIFLRVLG